MLFSRHCNDRRCRDCLGCRTTGFHPTSPMAKLANFTDTRSKPRRQLSRRQMSWQCRLQSGGDLYWHSWKDKRGDAVRNRALAPDTETGDESVNKDTLAFLG